MADRMSKTTDMTVGNPIRHILGFALPLLVGNVFQQLYNMVDSLVVGNFVGANALAAVGNCGAVNSLFFAMANGLSIGIGILAAQYFGAHNEEKIKSVIGNAIYALGTAALVMGVFGILLSPLVMQVLGTPDTLLADSVVYMRVTCAGMLGIAFYNGTAAVLRALGDARTPLYFLILSSIVNVVLDLLFVLQLDMGVLGVGLATVIAEFISAVACILYAYRKVSFFRLGKEDMKPDRKMIVSAFELGIPIAMQSAMISVSRMVLQGVINSFGESVMAASNIINRIEELVQQPFSSLHAALTTYAGQNIGARDTERVRKGYRQSAYVAVGFGLSMIPIAYLFGEKIIGAFVKDAEVIAIGTTALHINSLFYTVVGMIHVSRAVLNGCGDTGFALMNGLTEVICRVCYSQFFTRIPALGYWGIWVTTAATWTTTAVVCIIRYMSGIWKKKGMT